MSILEDLQAVVSGSQSELQEKKGIFSFEKVIAERKAFLSKKKLTYIAKFRIDEANREVRFTEMLKESGFGLSSGDSDMSPGFGFKKESYNTLSGGREGTIEEQSSLFGKDYKYSFDYAAIRRQFEQKAAENGYSFTYKLTGAGL
ncbi:MAG: hypothetical protein LLG06_09245 [Desulfobacteraceae bacterium]|nr:hypothetical protein [Desulfobacteraceae bacterium]